MAQSIYITLETLKTETSVPELKDKDDNVIRKSFGSVKHTLPRANYPTVEIFDNEEKFLAWAKEQGALHSLLQAGINDWLISDRSTFKGNPKKESGKVWSLEYGQERVNNRKWTIASKPKGAQSKEQTAMEYLSSLTPDELKEFMAKANK